MLFMLLVLSTIPPEPPPPTTDDHLWIEGEQSLEGAGRKHSWYDSVRRAELSGGDWFSHFDAAGEGVAHYDFELPAAGRYHLWLRVNPVKTRLSWSANGGQEHAVDLSRREGPLLNIASDEKPDLRFLAWIDAGELRLPEGPNRLRLRTHSEVQNHGGIDCLCLHSGDWRPEGTRRPGEEAPSWPTPDIDDHNLREWIDFVRPDEDDLAWQDIRWHRALADAAAEARAIDRPVLLWTMNGHPCGET